MLPFGIVGTNRRSAKKHLERLRLEPLEDRQMLTVLIADWKMNGTGARYADQSGNAITLGLDSKTAAPQAAVGVDGNAAQLSWNTSPGVSTRLITYSPAVQTNSFGFSFWVQPVNLSPNDNFIGKEMQATTTGPDYSRLAWQVHFGGDDGSGSAPLEFLVRGSNRSQSDFYGSVFSTVKIPLHVNNG